MSLILEALKKSEQQRRLGEAPTLGSPVVSTRRRRNLLPLFAMLIVIAAAAGWWLLRPSRRRRRRHLRRRMRRRRPRSATRRARKRRSRRAGCRATRRAPRRSPTPTRNVAAAPRRRRRQPAQARRTRRNRDPRADGVQAMTTDVGPTNARPRAPMPSAAPTPTRAAAPADRRRCSRSRDKPTCRAATGCDATATPPRAANSFAADAGQPRGARGPGAAAIWELPYSTRKDLPALDLTMHVYSSTRAAFRRDQGRSPRRRRRDRAGPGPARDPSGRARARIQGQRVLVSAQRAVIS